jgi:hypothetical protein
VINLSVTFLASPGLHGRDCKVVGFYRSVPQWWAAIWICPVRHVAKDTHFRATACTQIMTRPTNRISRQWGTKNDKAEGEHNRQAFGSRVFTPTQPNRVIQSAIFFLNRPISILPHLTFYHFGLVLFLSGQILLLAVVQTVEIVLYGITTSTGHQLLVVLPLPSIPDTLYPQVR